MIKSLQTRVKDLEWIVKVLRIGFNNLQVNVEDKISKSVGTTYTTNSVLTLTQAEYDAIATKDPNTLYFIV